MSFYFAEGEEQPVPGSEEPDLKPGLDEDEVSPGIEGFLLTALMVALCIMVFRLMIRSVRKVKLRSEDAEDMLVERNQSYLTEEQRARPENDDLTPDKTEVYKKKYPGYLDAPTLEEKSPDSGRDDI